MEVLLPTRRCAAAAEAAPVKEDVSEVLRQLKQAAQAFTAALQQNPRRIFRAKNQKRLSRGSWVLFSTWASYTESWVGCFKDLLKPCAR